MYKYQLFRLKNDKKVFVNILKMYIYLVVEAYMHLSWKKMRNISFWGIGILSLFLFFSYSDNTMIGFSDYSILSWSQEVATLNLEITWGDTTGFTVIIYNKETISMTYRLWFVDGFTTTDWFNHKTCLSPQENQKVGQYISWNTSLFTIAAWDSQNKVLSVKFPPFYSGIYYWCITLNANTTDGGSDMDTLPRRGVFLDSLVHPSIFPVNVKAFPSNRVYQDTNKSNIWILKFYDIGRNFITASEPFMLNAMWTGIAFVNISPWAYYAVFKWQSHLASYLNNAEVVLGTGNFFDFTVGTNLHGAQNLDSQTDDGNKYQTAWDLKNTAGNYDFIINGNDISILLYGTFPQLWVSILEPRNLNWDTAVNASDISVIWSNFMQQDAYLADWGLFIW